VPVATEEHHGTLRLLLLGISQTAVQNHCGLSPLAAWVVHIVTVVFGGAELNRTALVACRVS